MKSLMVTNHAFQQYMARTGKNQLTNTIELINSIRTGTQVTYENAQNDGFNITRKFKGDTYYVWYDLTIKDYLLAIIAKDGAIKTILRKEIYAYRDLSSKFKNDTKERSFNYNYESPKRKKRKNKRRMQ